MQNTIARRDLIKVAGATAALAGAAAVCATAQADESAIEWADEADFVIVGTGCAGLSAACTASFEGLGDCLVLEVAPKEMRGGNSSATAGIVFCPDSTDAAIEYQGALNAGYDLPEDVMQAWAEELCANLDWMRENFGCEFKACEQGTWGIQGEYPFMPRAQECPSYNVTEGTTWNVLAAKFDELGVPTYYETRAARLVTNGEGEVVGVAAEDGRSFKARKAVLLACGGFEANPEMMRSYLPTCPPATPTRWARARGITAATVSGWPRPWAPTCGT